MKGNYTVSSNATRNFFFTWRFSYSFHEVFSKTILVSSITKNQKTKILWLIKVKKKALY